MDVHCVKGINRDGPALSQSVKGPEPDESENEQPQPDDQQPQLTFGPEPPQDQCEDQAGDYHLDQNPQICLRQQQVEK